LIIISDLLRLLTLLLLSSLLNSCCLRTSPHPEGPGISEDSKRLLSLYSPDKKKLLTITEGQRSTQVFMTWPCAGSSVYVVEGIDKNLSAYWKDNSTIVIETFKNYTTDPRLDPLNKRRQVQNLDDIVKIEYIEK